MTERVFMSGHPIAIEALSDGTGRFSLATTATIGSITGGDASAANQLINHQWLSDIYDEIVKDQTEIEFLIDKSEWIDLIGTTANPTQDTVYVEATLIEINKTTKAVTATALGTYTDHNLQTVYPTTGTKTDPALMGNEGTIDGVWELLVEDANGNYFVSVTSHIASLPIETKYYSIGNAAGTAPSELSPQAPITPVIPQQSGTSSVVTANLGTHDLVTKTDIGVATPTRENITTATTKPTGASYVSFTLKGQADINGVTRGDTLGGVYQEVWPERPTGGTYGIFSFTNLSAGAEITYTEIR